MDGLREAKSVRLPQVHDLSDLGAGQAQLPGGVGEVGVLARPDLGLELVRYGEQTKPSGPQRSLKLGSIPSVGPLIRAEAMQSLSVMQRSAALLAMLDDLNELYEVASPDTFRAEESGPR